MLGFMMAGVIGALMACTWMQAGYWRDSETLWTRTLACTEGNYVAHYNLGLALDEKGRVEEEIAQYQQALQIKPDYMQAHINLGDAFFQTGSLDEAVSQYQKALQIEPGYAHAHYNLGRSLGKQGMKLSPSTKKRCDSTPTMRKLT